MARSTLQWLVVASSVVLFAAHGIAQPGDPGACCFEDGTCIEVPAEDCLAQGGEFQGTELSCADVLCGTGLFTGIEVEEDPFALDGVTLLSDLGITGVRVLNIYAAFTNLNDQAIGVVGNPNNPFTVFTSDGSGFINAELGTDRPPAQAIAELVPEVNADSFYSIGNRLLDVGPSWSNGDGFTDNVVVAPGTPGPNEDPWGGGNDNMAWTVRPTLPPPSGGPDEPTPQSVAGNWPGNRVLLMRLVVNEGVDVAGSFGLFVNETNVGLAKIVAFFSSAELPACPGEGSCFEPNGTPGCEDETCCAAVCLQDPSCCDVGWDEACVQAAGELCADIVTGACCFEDGSCVEIEAEACLLEGGIFQGAFVECNPCPQPGACCLFDGSCVVLQQSVCDAANGLFQGEGVPCEAVECPQPPGACCFEDGSCTEVTEEECVDAGGDFQGDLSQCNPCPQPGACCACDGRCTSLLESL